MAFFGGLNSEGYDRQYTDRQLVRRIWNYLRPHRNKLVVIGFLQLVMSASGAAMPLLVSYSVDLLEKNLTRSVIAWVSLAILLTGLVGWAGNWWRRRLATRTVGDIVLTLRTDAFQAATEHDLSFYDKFSSGRIVSRITSDTQEFGQIVLLITDLISQFMEAGILGIILVRIEWRLSLVLFAFLPILGLAASSFRRIARTVTRRGMRAMANVNAAIKETVSGINVAKNFRQEAEIFKEFDEANQVSYKVNVQRGFVLSLVFPSLNALGGLGIAALVYFGGLNAAQGIVSVGAWYLFINSLDRFFFPILNLSAFWAQVQSGLSAAERVYGLIDADPAVVQVDSQSVDQLIGDIRFEGVTFRYNEGESVLDNFSLHIHPGENLAIVGHTGAGKTSIAKLIERYYEYQQGRILIDGRDIRTFNLESYRHNLGIVSQVPFLFSGTVFDNICYACSRQVDRSEVENLARQIGEGDWLETLPQGLDTQVGERGARLSMGQRQLVSLLRVIVHRPAIFILDEATASVDPFTEWQIQQALKMILANSTSILIAHRLSTVKAADRIIVLDKGKIIEEGNHQALLGQGGHYALLYNTYFRHQSLAYVEQFRTLIAEEADEIIHGDRG
jgi:ATP-binding cassette subfamily B protein